MRANINNKQDKEQYKNNFFTNKGYNILNNYIKSLIIKYVKTEEYPCKLGTVLGIPLFEYSDNIKSDEELIGRIKQLGQILGIKEISFKTVDNKLIEFYMDGNYTIK